MSVKNNTSQLQKAFCWVYQQWLFKLVNEKTDPLVIVLDFLFLSNCKYCSISRAVVFGIGLGLANVWGLLLIILALIMTIGESYWLCEKDKNKNG